MSSGNVYVFCKIVTTVRIIASTGHKRVAALTISLAKLSRLVRIQFMDTVRDNIFHSSRKKMVNFI